MYGVSPRATSTRATASVSVARGALPSLGQRNQRRGIAQSAAVIDAAELQHRLWRETFQRRGIDPLRPGLVADQRQRRRQLRLCDRGRQIVQLGVGEVAQIADRGGAVAGEHVEP